MSDFSCYVRVRNKSNHVLTIALAADEGSWQEPLVNELQALEISPWMRLEDPSGPYGSAGSISVTVDGTDATVGGSFGDPYVGDNSASASAQGLTPTMNWMFEGATGSPDDFEEGSVPSSGHPVYIRYTFTDTEGPEFPAPAAG